MKRTFVVVIDSLGVGYEEKSKDYGDKGANTLAHIFEAIDGKYKIPNLQKMGLCNLVDVKGNPSVDKPSAYYGKLKESSVGKDTMTGHWEIMGVLTTKPAVTFTDTGFPKDLVDELERLTGHKYMGNYAASGTEIIKDLGERQLETKEMILYTSADSVLQIAANEELYGLDEIYRVCQIARDMCSSKAGMLIGRKIAKIAKNCQVLCISHLSMVAAYANSHYYIYKEDDADKTCTRIKKLDEDGIIRELANISNSVVDDNSLAAARDLYNLAKSERNDCL